MCANLGDNELPLLMTHVPISKPVKKTMEMLVPHPAWYASQNPLANFRGLKIYRIPGNQTLPHLMYPFHTKRFAICPETSNIREFWNPLLGLHYLCSWGVSPSTCSTVMGSRLVVQRPQWPHTWSPGQP